MWTIGENITEIHGKSDKMSGEVNCLLGNNPT